VDFLGSFISGRKHQFWLKLSEHCNYGSMKDAPRTVAPATVAPQRHLLSRPRPSPNQHQTSISVSPSPSLELAPTPLTIWGATVAGEQVSGEHHSYYLSRSIMGHCQGVWHGLRWRQGGGRACIPALQHSF
jgi:hypothetical protein